jgi:hypothetical protein
VISSIAEAQALFALIFLLRAIVRRNWAANTAFVVLASAPHILVGTRPSIDAAFTLPASVFSLWVLNRFGVLSLTVATFVSAVLRSFPMTTDLSAWYSGTMLFALGTVLALALWSFRVALAGRPLLRDEFLDARG